MFLYYVNRQIGANYVLSFKAKFKNLCGKCMQTSRFNGVLQVLISHASKTSLFCQFVLVRTCKIFKDSQEMVWPECKQCSAQADWCECLFTSTFWWSLSQVENFSFRFPNIVFVTNLAVNWINCGTSLIFRDWVFWFGK